MVPLRVLFVVVIVLSPLVASCAEAECASGEGSIQVCPAVFAESDSVSIRMGARHPANLAIRRPDGSWAYIVFHDIQYSAFENFAEAEEVSFHVDELKGMTPIDGELEERKVFAAPGEYLIYLADNLETEPENTKAEQVTVTLKGSRANGS